MQIHNASEMIGQAETVGQGCRIMQLFPTGGMRDSMLVIDLLEIEPGGSTPLSAHAEEHVMFVLSGVGELNGAVESGPTVVLRKDSVVHIGHREVHALRNTGGETLRVLVSTPLVVRSERALGLSSYAKAEPVAAKAAADMPPKPVDKIVAQSAPASIKEEKPPLQEVGSEASDASMKEVDVQPVLNGTGAESAVEDEPPMPDISKLMKKGSDIAAIPKSEKRKPVLMPEPEPEAPVEATAQQEQEQEAETEDDAHSGLMELLLVFDGGSRGNPGQGYGSYMVQAPNRKPIIKRVEFGDNYTNNQAEYDTMIECLEYVIERLEATNRSPDQVFLDMKTDSDLVVNQITGSYKVKDAGLKTRNAKALDLLERFGEWKIEWHERDESVKLLGH